MSDPNEHEQHETDVPGVETDPGDDKNKNIAVDTNERLEKKDKHLDDIPEEQLEKERQQRLDADNRPENVEVDNSDRDFNPETGLFDDTDLEPPEDAPFAVEGSEG
jgi:hypothetical protein